MRESKCNEALKKINNIYILNILNNKSKVI